MVEEFGLTVSYVMIVQPLYFYFQRSFIEKRKKLGGGGDGELKSYSI